jgi:hypothetical protein
LLPLDALDALRALCTGVTLVALGALQALGPDSQLNSGLTHLAVVALDLAEPADGCVERFADLIEFQIQFVAGLRAVRLQN